MKKIPEVKIKRNVKLQINTTDNTSERRVVKKEKNFKIRNEEIFLNLRKSEYTSENTEGRQRRFNPQIVSVPKKTIAR